MFELVGAPLKNSHKHKITNGAKNEYRLHKPKTQ